MNKNKNRKVLLICGLILTIILIFLPILYTRIYHKITGAPEASMGRMDLSTVNLTEKTTYMDGQWEFYWNRFIKSEPEQSDEPDFMIKVPNEWSRYKLQGEHLPAGGYASYSLSLTNLSYDDEVTLYIPDFGSAYRIFIDGKIACESGIISKDRENIFTVPKATLYPVKLSKVPTHEVIIEVATTRFSGIYMAPILGDYQKIVSKNSFRNSIRFILFGIVLFSFIGLISMYLLSVRQKRNSFWMPVMILFILIRIMITTEFFSFWQPLLFFNISYEATNEMMYLVSFFLKYLLIFLIQEQCGIIFHKCDKIGFLVFYGVLYQIYLFAPQNIYNQFLSVMIPMLTFALDIFLFVKVYIIREKLQKFGIVAYLGSSLITIGLALDSFYMNGKIYMNMTLTMMSLFLVFLLIMGLVYNMHIGDLYDDFTKSSSRVELAKKQFSMQREYYETLSVQRKEIGKIKQEYDHFIHVTNQLAEEGSLDKLKEFLSEHEEKAKGDQLEVFCEHTIANSIIEYYYFRARECGIVFESKCDINGQILISDNDLCIILGNALDNAVHACIQMNPSKSRYISIKTKSWKGQWLIKVTNSYDGQLIIHDGRYLSSKDGNFHGFGLRNIELVVEGYGGFLQIEHNEKVFTLMAAI